ncbi:VanZ family protein [Algibacter sp. 2305UL17-15]|uniref:VanZ family protein n=1 Tax=Algibacter sp. 2305UL17-15 TaxID=3231268 RepID=UPI00345A8F9E
MLKRYALLLAIPYSIALATVSLMHLKNVPDVGVDYGDKIFHFLAYAVMCFLWYLVFRFKYNYTFNKAIGYAAILAIVFGIIIEVLQGTLTTKRSLDVYDALANSLGALLTSVVLAIKHKIQVKNE